MNRTIYLHVGSGKTGTSALQSFLATNLERIVQSGLEVPLIGVVESPKYIAHHFLSGTSRFSSVEPFGEWRKIAALNNEKVLISSEVLHNRISQEDGVEFFRAVKEILCGWNIKIIFYVRREDDWVESVYAQWIKSGTLRTGETLSEFARRYKPKLAKQIKLFEEVFSKESLIVRPFKRDLLINKNIIDDFFYNINHGVPDNSVLPSGDVNTRLPENLLDFKRIYNSVCTDQQQAQLINGDLFALGRMLQDGVDSSRSVRMAGLSQDERKHLRLKCEKSFMLLNKEFPQLDILFTEDDEGEVMDPELEVDHGEDDRRIVAFLLRRLYQRISALEAMNKASS